MEQWRQIMNFSIFHITNKLSKFTNYKSHQLWRIELKYDTKLGAKATFYILEFWISFDDERKIDCFRVSLITF